MHQERIIHPQTRLIIAGAIGFLIAILATVRIWIPALSLLGHLSQFSPLVRADIIIKFLSPLLSFVLAGGWAWVLLFLGERLILGGRKHNTDDVVPSRKLNFQGTNQQEPQPPSSFAPAVTPQEGTTTWGTRRPIAVPPLFQLDPTTPWHDKNLPATPLPLTNPAWSPTANDVEEEDAARAAAEGEEKATTTQAEQIMIMQSQVVDAPPEQQQQQKKTTGESQTTFSLQKPRELSQTPKPVTLTLLKQVRCWVQADDGTSVEVALRGGENAIRLIQLAYIAWRKGSSVDRDKMLTLCQVPNSIDTQ
ncbi:hypothetical protein ccbrp13_60200 [Ktedonobacteria bacterium brp13]|nr:hypothetical protein ccbrp13_60200 [Ktedonobacteria bacterium brp13]